MHAVLCKYDSKFYISKRCTQAEHPKTLLYPERERVGESSVPPLLFSCCEREQNDLQRQWNPDNRVFKSESFPALPFFFVIRHNDTRTQSAFLFSFLRKKAT